MKWSCLVVLLVLVTAGAEAQQAPTEALVGPVERVRTLILEDGELEAGADAIAVLRSGPLQRAELADLLELEAYAGFGLEDEARWTRALQELATLDPGRTLPSFYPLPLTRVLAGFSATARSLAVSLEHVASLDRIEVVGSLLHDEANLLRRLTLRARRVGDAGGWTEHDLAQGRVVIAADAGSEVELEAIAIGPNDVELARSGVDLVTIPRPVEVWEEPWFWGVLGVVAVALGVVGGSLGWALTQPRPLTLSTTWTLGM